MFKLDLEKAEELRTNCQHPLDDRKIKEIPKNIYFCLTIPEPLTVWITTTCGKFLKEMGIPDHLTCLLRNLYAGQEATIRTGHETMDCYKIGKGVQGCILSPCWFNFCLEYIM